MSKATKIRNLIVTGIYMGLLTEAMLMPVTQIPVSSFLQTLLPNLVHMGAYGMLMIICLRTLRLYLPGRRAIFLSFLFSFCFGVFMEFLQGFTGRDPSVLDAMYNLLGISVMMAAYQKGMIRFPEERDVR